ncbi:hypothetical protein EV191_101268 [Tamaricihabitans halophyticus]|uniref:DivIVA protein n=1 Tax=Tamaricihabitans halophyticus TaxID=1262583 RepID=A0A4R2R2U2_9PSEU|nr:cell division protein DivIVA [Tamaricihabitans halophyticus]TCP56327.1 hypothetical protein EV191_101268 [Tamaricihabitans halophyticus]
MPPEQDPELVPLNPGFDVVWHGFDRAQVFQYIEEVDANVQLLAADRDAALSQVDELTEALQAARSEVSKLHKRIDELSKGPHSEEDLDDRLRRMVRLANAQADEIVARAQAEADHSLATTEELSSKLRERYGKLLAEVDRQREELQTEHRSVVEGVRTELPRLATEAQRRREEQDATTEAHRTKIQDEFDAKLAADRKKLDEEIAERQSSSKAQAQQKITEATEEAERRIREATQRAEEVEANAEKAASIREQRATDEVERLRSLRGDVLAQVRSAQQVLGKSAALLEPLEQEQDEDTSTPQQRSGGSSEAGKDDKPKPTPGPANKSGNHKVSAKAR